MAKLSRKDRKYKQKIEPEIKSEEPIRIEEEPKTKKYNSFLEFYFKNQKQLLIFSLILLAICMINIGIFYMNNGEFIKKGISLKGGISLTIFTDSTTPLDDFQSSLKSRFPDSDISVREITKTGARIGLIIDATDLEESDIIPKLEDILGKIDEENISIETIGSSLGESFYKQTIKAVILAFLLMAIVVFITFRSLVPSLFVILAAFSDIVSTWAVLDLFNIRLSTAGIAAFLMLIGYSVDTDILLTTRVLKHKEGIITDRMVSAMKTGLTMTAASGMATLTAFILTQSPVLKQIMLILTIGLVFDVIYTWLQNASILRYYVEKKEKNE